MVCVNVWETDGLHWCFIKLIWSLWIVFCDVNARGRQFVTCSHFHSFPHAWSCTCSLSLSLPLSQSYTHIDALYLLHFITSLIPLPVTWWPAGFRCVFCFDCSTFLSLLFLSFNVFDLHHVFLTWIIYGLFWRSAARLFLCSMFLLMHLFWALHVFVFFNLA